ncbi:MAG: IS66 family transposase [Deltaproteobacteria bacterium]|nr:MAG: IS66 family transposase [Deltaproteobacteria bacterium]
MLAYYTLRQKEKKYKKVIKDHQAQLIAKDSKLQEINTKLQERDAKLQEKDAKLQERDAKLQEKDAKLQERDAKLQEKNAENLQLKEELLKIKAGKEKLKDNLEKYLKENKRLQKEKATKKKKRQRSDAGKHREVSTPSNKRTGKPIGAKGGGLKNPDPKEIDYTRHWRLASCPKCNGSLKNCNPIDHHDHYVRDLEKLKRGIRLVYIRHVIYRYRCPHCECLVSKYFGKLKNARYGIGMIAFVLFERLERGGSWEGIRTTLNHVIHTKECVPTVKTFIDWIRKYEPEMQKVYHAFLNAIGQSSFAYVDETGIPMDGQNWWLWVIVATEVVLYLPSETRGSDAMKDIFHEYKGILLSDFWSAYNKLNVEQQKCLEHLVRELRKINLRALDKRDKAKKKLEKDEVVWSRDISLDDTKPKKRGRPVKQPEPLTDKKRDKLEEIVAQSEKISRQLTAFYEFFQQAWKKDGNDMSVYTPIDNRISISEAELRLQLLIQEVMEEGPANADIERMIKRFEKYGPCLFTYLENPNIMPDNNAAEREIRPFVVQRKVSGNFISPEVMKIYGIHMSLFRTCKRNGVNYEEVIIPLLKGDTGEVLRLLGLREGEPPPEIECK